MLYVCVCMWDVPTLEQVWRSEVNLQELALTFHDVGSKVGPPLPSAPSTFLPQLYNSFSNHFCAFVFMFETESVSPMRP